MCILDTLPEGTIIRFALNGPIRTNLFLDSRELIAPKHRRHALEALEMELEQNEEWQWVICPEGQRESGLDRDTDTRRGTTIKPSYVVEARIEDGYLGQVKERMVADQRAPECRQLLERSALQSMQIRFFDFGYASFLANFTLNEEAIGSMTMNGLREAVETLRVNTISDQFDAMINQLNEAAGALIKQRDWEGEGIRSKAPGVAWVHRIFGLNLPDSEAFKGACEHIDELIFTSDKEELEENRETFRENSYIYASTGNSASVFSGANGENSWEAFFTLSEMIQMQNAFFAAAEDLEDDLFLMASNVSLEKDAIMRKPGIGGKAKKKIEGFSRNIVEFLEEGLLFKSAYLDYQNHLNPQETRIWKRLWDRWEIEDKFGHIAEKSGDLRVVYDRIVTVLDQEQAKFLNKFALWFTLAGGMSALVDILSFFFQFKWPPTITVLLIFVPLATWILWKRR